MPADQWTKAYPSPEHAGDQGMLLRDWFAGQALAAFAIGEGGMAALVAFRLSPMEVAQQCYALADAMTTERARYVP